MDYGIQDECFDELVNKGLLQDLVTLSAALGASFEVIQTHQGWCMTMKHNGHVVQLERKPDSLELALLDTERRKEYPCDTESVVGAAIDMMKASTRR